MNVRLLEVNFAQENTLSNLGDIFFVDKGQFKSFRPYSSKTGSINSEKICVA